MINKYNVMTNVDEVYGIHNTCNIYLKQIGTTHGTMMSRVDKFNIKIHYDKEEEKSSAIVAGSNLVNLINQIKSEGTFAVTCFNTKTNNIIDIKGTLRALLNEPAIEFINKITSIAKAIEVCSNFKTEIDIKSTDALINEKTCTDLIFKLSKENGYEINEFGLPAPSSDDFAFYLEKQKGCYFGFGIAETEEETKTNFVHSSTYNYNDNATLPIVNFLLILINNRLNINIKPIK